MLVIFQTELEPCQSTDILPAALLTPNSVFPFTVARDLSRCKSQRLFIYLSKLKTGFIDRYDLKTSYKKT